MTTTDLLPSRPDTAEMIVIHNVFRRLFGDLPGLVAAVVDGDTVRAATLSRVIEELATGLHHHHTLEDEMLLPLLLERVTAEQAVVLRAEEQHERVHELLDRLHVQLPPFRAHTRATERDALVRTLRDLDAALCEHMADEERDVLPVVQQHITVAEWEAMADRGRAGIPKDRLLVQLGWNLAEVSLDQRREFMSKLPLAARVAWRLVGRRRWERERAAVYGA